MSKLTITEGIVIENDHYSTDKHLGYCSYTLRKGDFFKDYKKRFGESSSGLKTYYVLDLGTKKNYTFSRKYNHGDSSYTISLTTNFEYRISDPTLILEKLNLDPLMVVEMKIAKEITARIPSFHQNDLFFSDTVEFEKKIKDLIYGDSVGRDNEVTTKFTVVNAEAKLIGLEVIDIQITRVLPEGIAGRKTKGITYDLDKENTSKQADYEIHKSTEASRVKDHKMDLDYDTQTKQKMRDIQLREIEEKYELFKTLRDTKVDIYGDDPEKLKESLDNFGTINVSSNFLEPPKSNNALGAGKETESETNVSSSALDDILNVVGVSGLSEENKANLVGLLLRIFGLELCQLEEEKQELVEEFLNMDLTEDIEDAIKAIKPIFTNYLKSKLS